MNRYFAQLGQTSSRNPGLITLFVGLTIASCGGSAPLETSPAPNPAPPEPIATAPEATPTPAVTPEPTTPTTPTAPTPPPVAAAPPEPDPVDEGSVFEGENFTVTITGFGTEAGYKGCDKQGQCLELAGASYEDSSYTWTNNGYTYLMQGTVRGNYRLEVRDPQGKVLVDEGMQAQPSGL